MRALQMPLLGYTTCHHSKGARKAITKPAQNDVLDIRLRMTFFIHQKATPMKKCVLYDLADVYLVTSVRVRMNLVSRKFIVCQQLLMCNKGERKQLLIRPQENLEQ